MDLSGAKAILALTVLLAGFAEPLPAADALTIAFPERKPYHFTDDTGAPSGVIIDRLQQALTAAHIDAQFVAMPIHRVLALIEQQEPLCSVSWFRTKERRRYAHFSIPIWQDLPHVLVAKPEHRDLLARFAYLRDINFDRPVRIGVIDKVSYGPFLDEIFRMTDRGFTLVKVVNNDANMYRMLDQGRFDLMVASPPDLEAGLASAGIGPDHIIAQGYPDIPPGGKRRLMCSKAVDATIIERLNKALEPLVPADILD